MVDLLQYTVFQPLAGDVFLADLHGNQGDELGGIRPVLVVQRNDLSRKQNTVIVLPMEEDRGQVIPAEALLGIQLPRVGYSWLPWRRTVVRADAVRSVDIKRFTAASHAGRVSRSEYRSGIMAVQGTIRVSGGKEDPEEEDTTVRSLASAHAQPSTCLPLQVRDYLLFQLAFYIASGELAL